MLLLNCTRGVRRRKRCEQERCGGGGLQRNDDVCEEVTAPFVVTNEASP